MAALAMPRESAVEYCGGLFTKAQGLHAQESV